MAENRTPLVERNRMTLKAFLKKEGQPLNLVQYGEGETSKVFLKVGDKTLYSVEKTRAFISDTNKSEDEVLEGLVYVECKKSELDDVKDPSQPESATVVVDGKSVPNSNWVACAIRFNPGKVLRSFSVSKD